MNDMISNEIKHSVTNDIPDLDAQDPQAVTDKWRSDQSDRTELSTALKRVEIAMMAVLEERIEALTETLLRRHGPAMARRFLPDMIVGILAFLAGYGFIYECTYILTLYLWPSSEGAFLGLISHGFLFCGTVIFLSTRQRLRVLRESKRAIKALKPQLTID